MIAHFLVDHEKDEMSSLVLIVIFIGIEVIVQPYIAVYIMFDLKMNVE